MPVPDKAIVDLQHQSFGEAGDKIVRQVLLLDEDGNPITSFGAAIVGVKDAADVRINPAKEDGHLEDIAAYLDTVEAKLQSIIDALDGLEGFTDGIETLLTTLGGYVDQLEGYTDQLEAYLDTVETKLAAIQAAVEGATPAGANTIGNVNQAPVKWLEGNSFDVDNSSVQIVDSDGSGAGAPALQSTCVLVLITNAGEGDLFVRVGGSAPVADGSSAYYDFKLAKGESRFVPVGYTAPTSTVDDIYALRASAQTNDNVIVSQFKYY